MFYKAHTEPLKRWFTQKRLHFTDFHSMEEKSKASINCLVTDILQNISFVFSRRKKVKLGWNNLRVS